MKKRECVRASLLFAPSVVARLVASIIPTYAIVPWRCPGDGGGHFGIGLVHALVTRNKLRPCVLGRLSLLLFRDIEGISARTKFVAIVARQDTMLLCAVHVWRAG